MGRVEEAQAEARVLCKLIQSWAELDESVKGAARVASIIAHDAVICPCTQGLLTFGKFLSDFFIIHFEESSPPTRSIKNSTCILHRSKLHVLRQFR